MYDSELFAFLRVLSEENWSDFSQFLTGYCKKESKAFKIFTTLKNKQELLHQRDLSLPMFCRKVSRKGFSQNDYYNHSKKVLIALKRYILLITVESNPEEMLINLETLFMSQNRAFQKNFLNIYIEGISMIIPKIQENDKNIQIINRDKNLLLHKLYDRAYHLFFLAKDEKQTIKYLESSIKHLHRYKFLMEIKAQIQAIYLNKLYGLELQVQRFKPNNLIEEGEKKTYLRDDLVILMNINLLKLLSKNSSKSEFKTVADQFTKIAEHLSEAEQIQIAVQLINYANSKINQGDKDYEILCLGYFRKWLEAGYLIETGILSDKSYLNIIELEARHRHFDRANSHLETYEEYLLEENRLTVKMIGKASILFHGYHYRDCLQKIQSIKPSSSEIGLKLRMYLFELRSTFMLNLFDPEEKEVSFETKADNFRQFLKNNKNLVLSPEREKALHNTKRVLHQLGRLYHKRNDSSYQDQKQKILGEIKSIPLISKRWILDQVRTHF